MDHAGLKGRFREIFVADLLQPVLSSDFLAGSGLVIDSHGGTSSEVDVVVFDKFHVPAVLYKGSDGLFPIEGVYYYGEIKSRLTKPELKDAVEKFRRYRSLNPLPNRQGQKEWGPRFIFAWSSDLKEREIDSELHRYFEVDGAAAVDPAASIICVVGKGYCFFDRRGAEGARWLKVGNADGIQEVVNFIGGIANSIIDFRMQKFGMEFGNYIIPGGPLEKIIV
jgi:hypothetical protein